MGGGGWRGTPEARVAAAAAAVAPLSSNHSNPGSAAAPEAGLACVCGRPGGEGVSALDPSRPLQLCADACSVAMPASHW